MNCKRSVNISFHIDTGTMCHHSQLTGQVLGLLVYHEVLFLALSPVNRMQMAALASLIHLWCCESSENIG